MNEVIWQECLGQLENEVNGDQFETYLRPLQADFSRRGLTLLAPTIYVEEKVRSTFLARITEYLESKSERGEVLLSVGGMREVKPLRANTKRASDPADGNDDLQRALSADGASRPTHNLNRDFTFASFVEGKSMNWLRPPPLKSPTTLVKVITLADVRRCRLR